MTDTLAFFDRGAAAFAVCMDVPFLRTIPGQWQLYEFDNTDGRAAEALRLWKTGATMVNAKTFWTAFKNLRQTTINPTTSIGEKDNGSSAEPVATIR